MTIKAEIMCFAKRTCIGFSREPCETATDTAERAAGEYNRHSQLTAPEASEGFSDSLRKNVQSCSCSCSTSFKPQASSLPEADLCLKKPICESLFFPGFLLGSFYCTSPSLGIARQRAGFQPCWILFPCWGRTALLALTTDGLVLLWQCKLSRGCFNIQWFL